MENQQRQLKAINVRERVQEVAQLMERKSAIEEALGKTDDAGKIGALQGILKSIDRQLNELKKGRNPNSKFS